MLLQPNRLDPNQSFETMSIKQNWFARDAGHAVIPSESSTSFRTFEPEFFKFPIVFQVSDKCRNANRLTMNAHRTKNFALSMPESKVGTTLLEMTLKISEITFASADTDGTHISYLPHGHTPINVAHGAATYQIALSQLPLSKGHSNLQSTHYMHKASLKIT